MGVTMNDDIRRRMAQLTDEQLVDILRNIDDYTPEGLQIAQEEINKRGGLQKLAPEFRAKTNTQVETQPPEKEAKTSRAWPIIGLLVVGSMVSVVGKQFGQHVHEKESTAPPKQSIPAAELPLPQTQQANFTDYGFIHHRDEDNFFSIWFPKSWAMVPTSHSETKLKIVSNDGAGVDDVNVVVMYSDELKKTTASQYAKTLTNADAYVERLKTYASDIALIEHGPTHLSSQPGYYYITTMTVRSFGFDIPNKQLQIHTLRDGYGYTITCRTEPERFDEMLPIFKLMLAGFVIKPQMPD